MTTPSPQPDPGQQPPGAVPQQPQADLPLAELRSPAEGVIPAKVRRLIQGLKDQDAGVRWRSARALGGIGPSAVDAVPALIEGLKDQDVDVRWAIADALGRIGPAALDAVPALIEGLKDQDVDVRFAS